MLVEQELLGHGCRGVVVGDLLGAADEPVVRPAKVAAQAGLL